MKEAYPSCSSFNVPAKGTVPVAARSFRRIGFTLTEVILAVGVLSLAIVALIGLFGPTMGAVKGVIDRSGALAIADQFNAQLMSGEIYDSYAIAGDEDGDAFYKLSSKLLTTSDGKTWPGTPTTGVLYAWKEYDTNGSTRDLADLKIKFSPDLPKDGTNGFSLDKIEGSVYMIFLGQGLQGGTDNYSFTKTDVDKSAYFPIYVSIYETPMPWVINGRPASPTLSTLIKNYMEGKNGQPLFQYTTAKLR